MPFDAAVHTATLPNGLNVFRRARTAARPSASRCGWPSRPGRSNEADDQLGPRAPHRAHGVQRQRRTSSRASWSSYFESIGARLGPHVNALYELRRDGLHARPADRQAGDRRRRADRARRLRRRADARSPRRSTRNAASSSRSGAAARRRIAHPRQAVPGALLSVALRRAAADRQAGDPPQRAGRAAARVLRHLVSARADGGRRRRRHRCRSRSRQTIKATFGADQGARAGSGRCRIGRCRCTSRPLVSVVTDPEVTQSTRADRLRKRPRESEQRVADYRRDLVAAICRAHAERALRRAGAQARREVPRRRRQRRRPEPRRRRPFTMSAQRAGRQARGRLGVARDRGASASREFGFSAAELDRAKQWMAAFYERAYSERDKTESGSFAQEYLQLLPRRTSRARASRTSTSWCSSCCRASPPPRRRRWRRSLLGDDSRVDPRDVAAEGRHQGADRGRAAGGARRGRSRARVTPWTDTTTTRELMERKPAPAAVASRRDDRRRRRHRSCRFANGVEAWLKPTDFKNDQVVFALNAPGGTSLAPRRRLSRRRRSRPRYVELSGAGGLKALDLQKLLAGKLASARAVHRAVDARHSAASPRRRSSRPRCSCSTRSSPRRATTRRRSRS